MRPGELARRAGLSTDTLRHYERKGLLKPSRSSNGYRSYPPSDLARVRLVQQALSVGFTLDELARVLRERDRGGAPCRQARALAAAKLQSAEEQIRGLTMLRDQLRALLREWDARLARTPEGHQARLLDGLLESPPGSAPRRPGGPALPRRRRGGTVRPGGEESA